MKVAVVGAGAIGACVGAALHRAGAEVHLIARGPHHPDRRSERHPPVVLPRPVGPARRSAYRQRRPGGHGQRHTAARARHRVCRVRHTPCAGQ
ncbi:ketopantoate reductase family protein [Streptomyces sp. NPDC005151]